ncbi:MAG: hypothetical protein QM737_23230 [Ferruginibacter sp.]
MFDDIIKQKVNSHQAPVPADAWENIVSKKKKRRFGFFWWMSCIILLCGLSILGYYTFSDTKNNDKIASVKNESSPVENSISSKNEPAVATDQQSTGNKKENTETEKQTNNTEITTNNTADNKIKNDEVNNPVVTNEKSIKENEATAGNTNIVSAKDQKKKNDAVVNIASTTPVKLKPAISSQKNNIEPISPNKKDKDENDPSFPGKNSIVKTEKARTKIKAQAGETEILTDNKPAKKNKKDIAANEPLNNNDQQKTTIAEKKDLTTSNDQPPIITADKKDIAETSVSKKELAIDSVQTKKPLAITTDENKKETTKEKTTVNKPAKRHAWFIDVAVSPVLPIQQYDKASTFTRTASGTDNVSVFTGKLVSTSIDPSAAFSLALRREMSNRFFVGVGIQYLKLNEQVKISGTETNTKFIIVDRLVDNALINDTVKSITEGNRQIAATNCYQFLSIPVFIQYNFVQKQSWSLGIVAGINVNLYSKYQNEINKNASAPLVASSQTTNNENKIGFSFYGGFRFGKRISKRMELFGTPSITWAAGKQNIKNSLLDKKIQSAGLSVGLSYRIKK